MADFEAIAAVLQAVADSQDLGSAVPGFDCIQVPTGTAAAAQGLVARFAMLAAELEPDAPGL